MSIKHVTCSYLALACCLASASFAQDIVEIGQTDPVVERGRSQRRQPVTGRYYVQFEAGATPGQRATAALQAGVGVLHNFTRRSGLAVLSANDNAINGLRNHPLVRSVTPDQVLYLHAKPVKTPPMWGFTGVNAGIVELNWIYSATSPAGYELERCNGGTCLVFDVGLTTQFVDDEVAAGLTYGYRVRAYPDKGGPSDYSTTASITVPNTGPVAPIAPSGLTVTSVSNSFVTLSWTDNSNDETGFELVRCVGACVPTAPGTVLAVNSVTHTDSTVSADTTYSFAVRAFSAAGVSSYSNIAQIATSSDPVDPTEPEPCGVLSGTRQVIPLGVQRAGLPNCVSNGAGIGVAVVDTGIDFTHPDLAPAPDAPGVLGVIAGTSFNALAPGTSCQDNWSHGTHVAGLIAAVDNNAGIVGTAPYATLYCVKVGATPAGEIFETDVFAGLDWILENHDQVAPPIRVVNMSLGGDLGDDPLLDQLYLERIQALYQVGIVVVTSAGNDPTSEISQKVPAAFSEVISVAGTVGEDGIQTCPSDLLPYFGLPGDLAGVLADTAAAFTTDGPDVTISAVAEGRSDFLATSSGCTGFLYGTLSTSLGGTTTRKLATPGGLAEARGTSFAAPVIAGIAAQILQGISPTGTSADVEYVRAQLKAQGDRTGEAPLDHPWAGSIVIYSPDGVYEGLGQRP
jgi:hypothetical protein